MRIFLMLMVLGIVFVLLLAPDKNAIAEGYKSAKQIMEYAAQLDNHGERERAIRMYQAIVERYPDSNQAKMAKSRMGVLQGRIVEEKELAERSRQTDENRRVSEQSAINEPHNRMCHSVLENCQAGCGSNSNSNCMSHCWSGYQDCKK